MARGAYIGAANFESRPLPSGYTQVEYIESSGTQYIDTGFKANQDTKVVMDCMLTKIPNVQAVFFGGRTSATSKAYAVSYNVTYFRYFYNGSYDSTSVKADPTTRCVIISDKNILTIGNYTHSWSYGDFQCDYTMYLFTLNKAGSTDWSSSLRLFSCKIYDNGTLVRDFVPCTNSSGIAGLYDVVNNIFYTNAGTGTFTAGSFNASVARKIKTPYIGIETEIPIYKTEVTTINITAANIAEYFTVSNGSYSFSGSGSTFTTNNSGISGSTASTTLTAKQDMDISFGYSYSSETNYDKFTLVVGGTTIENAVSGTTTQKTYTGSITSGSTIKFQYTKNASVNSYNDACSFYNMIITIEVKTLVGVENKGIAREIKKAYIGVDNIARQCFPSGVSWGKYSCNISGGYYYLVEEEIDTTDDYWFPYNGIVGPFSSDYEFYSSTGFILRGDTGRHFTEEATLEDIKNSIEGLYYTTYYYGGYEILYYIKSVDSIEHSYQGGNNVVAFLSVTQIGTSYYEAPVYSQGGVRYGAITASEGELPENGTLIEGSVEEGYCVLYIDSTYYYYVLEG